MTEEYNCESVFQKKIVFLKAVVFRIYELWTPLYYWDLLSNTKSLCFCGLRLSIFNIIEIKTEKLVKYLLTHLKIARTHCLLIEMTSHCYYSGAGTL